MTLINVFNVLIWSWNIYTYHTWYKTAQTKWGKRGCLAMQVLGLFFISFSIGRLVSFVV